MSSNLPASLPAPTKINLRFSFSLFFHVSTDSALRSCALACKLASDHNNQINRPKRPIDRYHPTGPRNKSDRLFYLVLSLVSPFFYSAPVFLTLVRQLEIPRYTVASVAGRAGFFFFFLFFFFFFSPQRIHRFVEAIAAEIAGKLIDRRRSAHQTFIGNLCGSVILRGRDTVRYSRIVTASGLSLHGLYRAGTNARVN